MIKYVSIDIETTGLDPDKCQIIEFGAVIDSGYPLDKLPRFRRLMQYERFYGEPHALSMHAVLFEAIAAKSKDCCHPDYLMMEFGNWLVSHGYSSHEKVVVAGKNFGSFDLQFLRRLDRFDYVKFHHRFIDPGMLRWSGKGGIPSLGEMLLGLGLSTGVGHTAVEDALDVIRVIRHHFGVNDA